ncbi:protocadherin-15-like [Mytilus edulis]|uniref:protocadherin-15-like n=1 Tax=Mytilus edulis TaxID=6550 RepID=UPI0039EECC71
MTLLLCIVLSGLAFIDVVRSSSCSDSLNKIPYQIRLKETETGLQFNISLNSSDSWSLEVKQINGRTLQTRKKDYVRTFFNLTANNETNVLSFNVVKELDLEGFLKYIQIQISSIQLNFKCGVYDEREIAVLVGAVNEFAPYFKDRPYTYAMTEDKTNGTTIFTVPDHVVDKDVLRNGGFNYYIEQYKVQPSVDGRDYFQIKFSSSGLVTLKNSIDFDDLYRRGKPTYFMLNLTAEDTTNLRSWTTLNVSIIDVDDQKPMFSMCVPPCQKAQYRTNTQVGYRGVLVIKPMEVFAKDPDTFNNSIVYTLEPVPYQYASAFSIDSRTGEITQNLNVLDAGVLIIKATEDSAKQLFDDATLLVTLGNGTSVTPPPVGKSVNDDTGNLKLVIIILAVVSLLIIIVIIIVFVVYHKKVAKAVRPADDGKEGSADISHSQNWQAMNSGSKTELLASDMLNPALMATPDGRGNTLLPLTKDSATGTGKKRSRRRNRNKEPEIFDGTREYEGKLDMEFFTDANTKSKIKQSTRSRDTKTDPKYWITIPNDDE